MSEEKKKLTDEELEDVAGGVLVSAADALTEKSPMGAVRLSNDTLGSMTPLKDRIPRMKDDQDAPTILFSKDPLGVP